MLRSLRIGTRLALGFGLVLAIVLAISVAATWLGQKSRDDLAAVHAATGNKLTLASDMKALALEQSAVMRNIGLHSDIKAMQADEDRARSLGKALDDARDRMAALPLSAQEREIIEALKKTDRDIEAPFQQALGLSTSFRNEEAAAVLIKEVDPIVQRTLEALNRLIELQKKASDEATAAAMVTGDRLARTVYAVEVVALILAVLVAWTITRSIVGPLRDSVTVARRVASGDLTSNISAEGSDEAAELLGALRDMNDGLGRMVSQIRSGADSIAVGAGQVAAGNQQLSSRTEEHASSLEETASTLEEFTTTVKQSAEHARQASSLAATASTTAQKGGEVVTRVVATFQEVSESSKRIGDIIAVIDGISFQTNILALNAAVEAARAGEQGRGFAVVASEVRSLAQRSAESAKEIRGLIENSVGRVEAGAKLVEQAGKTMEELVTSVKKVAEIMTEIASASHEQSSGIEQINKAITQMDTVVQMNASLVEEATAAATSMASQATGLAHAVAQFRVDEAAVARAVPAQPAKPLARAPSVREERPASTLPPRREPLLTAATAATGADEEWKEF
ncbi:MAG TPA: methyl-accepting chemotaxis protein [Usitatibacter sp.]|jgi:methyl-accepting chemotaxis protein|nr:methyl-accepting chemotaxis protein [Usitatibacter sp.]